MTDIANNTNLPKGRQNTNNPGGALPPKPGQILASWNINPTSSTASHWETLVILTNSIFGIISADPDNIIYRIRGQFTFQLPSGTTDITDLNVSVLVSYSDGSPTAVPGLSIGTCLPYYSGSAGYCCLAFDELYRAISKDRFTLGLEFTANIAETLVLEQFSSNFTVDAIYLPKGLSIEDTSSVWTT